MGWVFPFCRQSLSIPFFLWSWNSVLVFFVTSYGKSSNFSFEGKVHLFFSLASSCENSLTFYLPGFNRLQCLWCHLFHKSWPFLLPPTFSLPVFNQTCLFVLTLHLLPLFSSHLSLISLFRPSSSCSLSFHPLFFSIVVLLCLLFLLLSPPPLLNYMASVVFPLAFVFPPVFQPLPNHTISFHPLPLIFFIPLFSCSFDCFLTSPCFLPHLMVLSLTSSA